MRLDDLEELVDSVSEEESRVKRDFPHCFFRYVLVYYVVEVSDPPFHHFLYFLLQAYIRVLLNGSKLLIKSLVLLSAHFRHIFGVLNGLKGGVSILITHSVSGHCVVKVRGDKNPGVVGSFFKL